MVQRIKQLSIACFRGATCPVEFDFEISKPAIVIFGENGTGKSTIVDTLDFICNGEIGSLKDRSSTRPREHLPSLNSDHMDLNVSIIFGGNTWEAKLDGGSPNITGPEGRPSARILRRSKILQVINEQPKQRYEALRSFIAVPGIEKSENSLRAVIKTVEEELNEAARAYSQAKTALEQLWEAEGKPEDDHWKWACQEAAKKPDDLTTLNTNAKNLIAALINSSSAKQQLDKDRENYQKNEARQKEDEKNLAAAEARAATSEIGATLVILLNDAKKFLEENQKAKLCPVCEREIEAKKLLSRIAGRLIEMSELDRLQKALERTKKNVSNAKSLGIRSRDKLVNHVKNLIALIKASKISEITKLNLNWDNYSGLLEKEPSTTSPKVLEQALKLMEVVAPYQTPLEKIQKDTQKSFNQLNAIQGHVSRVKENGKSMKELDTLDKQLKSILQVIETQRKGYVEEILKSISGTVDELFQKVHPGEGIGCVEFFLKPRVQGSLEFTGNFQTASKVPPQAYYSESHLDTLGVCVFLGLAKYFNDGNTIVVLDDVITSIDQAHMDRFMHLLHDEAQHFNQLIITTHYRPWRDKYRYARGPAGNVQLIELLHWSLPRGIRHTKTKLSIEELREYLVMEPMDRQIVSSKAGILLESLLDHLALLYECKLPRKPEPQYTLGDLTDCISSKLRKTLKIENMAEDTLVVAEELALESILNTISGMNWIRNQVGCHWNISGMDIGNSEIEGLANGTIQLAESLVCEYCGELPRVENDGSFWRCRCSRKRLYPLNNP